MKAVRWVPWKRPLLVKPVLCSDKEELGVLGMGSASACTQETGTVNLAEFCKSHRYRVFFCEKPRILGEIHLISFHSQKEFEYCICKVLQ